MLARRAAGPFDSEERLFEVKWDMVVDGELVVVREGKPCCAGVMRRSQLLDTHRVSFEAQALPTIYLVFDLLYLRGLPDVGVRVDN